MSLFIEPGETTVEVAGEKIAVKILTARDSLKVQRLSVEIIELATGVAGENATVQQVLDIRDVQFSILELGLAIDPDVIRVEHWTELIDHIIRENILSGEDAKN